MGDQIRIPHVVITFFFPSFSKAILRRAELPSLCNVVFSCLSTFCSLFCHGRIVCVSCKETAGQVVRILLNSLDCWSFKIFNHVWIIRKFIQLVNFVTFSVFFSFFGNRVLLNLYERVFSGNETSIVTRSFYFYYEDVRARLYSV